MLNSPESDNLPIALAVPPADASAGTEAQGKIILYLFLAALVVRLWFNFGTEHFNCFNVADAAEYLRYATALSQLNFAAPVFGPEWKEFAISGPTFPFFLWLSSLASFSSFDANRSEIFLIAQSLLSALTVVLIALIGRHFWNKQTGFVSGVIAALYPGFIVNSGRLYSESFATFLECGAIALLIPIFLKKNGKSSAYIVGLGALLILLQLTRSSMILFTVSIVVLVLLNSFKLTKIQDSLKAIALMGLGMALVLAPWFVFQKQAFNKMTPIVDRVGAYNLFIGTDTKGQGFLTYPYPDGRGIEQKSYIQLAKESFKASPTRFIKLAFDKPARLYKFPWNDFRIAIGPISFQAQVLFHQIVVLLAVFGLSLALVTNIQTDKKSLYLSRFAVLLMFILNLPYLAFITVPRYNLLAMPALIILAGAGLTTMFTLLKKHPQSKAPKIAAMAALFILFYWRDELRAPLSLNGTESATLYFVQGSDLLVRSLIASAAAITMFAAIFLTSKLLAERKGIAQLITASLAFVAVTLALVPQRANGRPGEGIITLNRPGEKINGTIKIAANDSSPGKWFLLVDSDRGQLLKKQFDLKLNGKPLAAAAIPSLTALDDWHYWKTNKGKAFVECAYIFDCLSSPAALSNSELRQWFAIPLAEDIVAAGSQSVNVEITQKSEQPSTLFSAALDGKKAVIPTRGLYSWEKAFYGVENDNGLTDPRMDEKVERREDKWFLSYEKDKAELANVDLNIRLVKVQQEPASLALGTTNDDSSEAQGLASLKISDGVSAHSKQLFTVSFEPIKQKENLIDEPTKKPELYLSFVGPSGESQKLPILGLPADTKTALTVSFVTDLAQLKGHNYQLNYSAPGRLKLRASALNCHPLFSPQELY